MTLATLAPWHVSVAVQLVAFAQGGPRGPLVDAIDHLTERGDARHWIRQRLGLRHDDDLVDVSLVRVAEAVRDAGSS